ncbi:MAG: hypothetical protein P1U36_08205 [Legionellaceae bacterium]|nr:hypothetical protein [Legionellaceae bacterium]
MFLNKLNASHSLETKPIAKNNGKILLFSYAFPPMQVQMTPAVFKPMAAFSQLGYQVDVLCADSFCPHLSTDVTLLPFVESYFGQVHRLNPHITGWRRIKERVNIINHVPDLMESLHQPAYEYLMDLDLSQYQCVITFSPFHSINAVMARVKKHRNQVRWIAQFSDPWAGNPLEVRALNKLWNYWHQPHCIKKMDHLIHASPDSLNLMVKRKRQNFHHKTTVLPHAYSDFLYPNRPKAHNAKITLRYVGALYGRRSPEPLFAALLLLLKRRKTWSNQIQIELIGQVSSDMLNTTTAKALPQGMISHIKNVNYLQSLALMYDADILLLIDADIKKNLFLASKLSDYLGANTPIVGLVPSGSSEDILSKLGAYYAHPSNIEGISDALEKTLDTIISNSSGPPLQETFRQSFKDVNIAQKLIQLIH